jgi:hypothetical protein
LDGLIGLHYRNGFNASFLAAETLCACVREPARS